MRTDIDPSGNKHKQRTMEEKTPKKGNHTPRVVVRGGEVCLFACLCLHVYVGLCMLAHVQMFE